MPGDATQRPAAVPGWAIRTLKVAAALGGTGVLLGAFGAHTLADRLTPDRLETFETAVRYQLFHTMALLAIGVLAAHRPSPALRWAARLMVGGVVVFSGSLYVLVATDVGLLGAVTPIGGVAMIAGWLALFRGVAAEP